MNERQKRTGAPVMAIVLVAMLLLPVLYVLASGPAAWMVNNGHLEQETFATAFYPVFLAAQKFWPFANFLGWYLSFFGPV